MEIWENSKKLWKHSPAARVPTAFLIFLNFHSCFYNSTEIRYMFFYVVIICTYRMCTAERNMFALLCQFVVPETNKGLQSHSCRIHFKLFFCRLFFRQRNFKYGKFGTQYKQITVVSNETPFTVTCQENCYSSEL